MTRGQRNLQKLRNEIEDTHKLVADRWGHYKFTAKNGRSIRIKFQKQSVRVEAKYGSDWHKLRTYGSGTVTIKDLNILLPLKM